MFLTILLWDAYYPAVSHHRLDMHWISSRARTYTTHTEIEQIKCRANWKVGFQRFDAGLWSRVHSACRLHLKPMPPQMLSERSTALDNSRDWISIGRELLRNELPEIENSRVFQIVLMERSWFVIHSQRRFALWMNWTIAGCAHAQNRILVQQRHSTAQVFGLDSIRISLSFISFIFPSNTIDGCMYALEIKWTRRLP